MIKWCFDDTKYCTRGCRNIGWIQKHCFIPEGKDVGKPVILRSWQRDDLKMIYDNPHGTRMAIISFAKKNAKALSLDTPIPTPGGWKTISDIESGDMVYGVDGSEIRVSCVSEVFIGKPCSEIEFSDGSVITCSDDHLWTTRHCYRPWANPRISTNGNGGRERAETISTQIIKDTILVPTTNKLVKYNHKMGISGTIKSKDIGLPIDPYVLGYWLGDGTSKSAAITSGEQDVEHVVSACAIEGDVVVHRYRDRSPRITVRGGLQKKLRANGLLGSKHIPDIYFDSGDLQRRALLQGMMDSDGTVNAHAGKTTARCSFTNKSYVLSYGVWRLARSLGLKATMRSGESKLNGKSCGKYYEASFSAPITEKIFRLPRKQNILPKSIGKRSSVLSIVRCESVDSVPTKCLMVESEDSLFLVGHGCIPTHNTTFSSFLLLLHLSGPESIQNTQLPSTATSRDQAAVLFELAAKIVRMSPTLSEFVMIRDTNKQLYCPERGTLYRALSADASTAHGQSPIFAVHDELGQVRGPRSELFNAVENAMGAHDNPMSVVISTQAPTDGDLLSILIDDALKGEDPRVVVSLYVADDDIDPFSEEAVKQANPAYGDFLNATEVMSQAAQAERMPAQEALFRNYTLNQRVEASSPFVTQSVWSANKGDNEDWGVCYGGLDLSETNDLTSFTLTSQVDGITNVKCWFWLPDEGLAERSKKDRVPYDVWHKQGFLNTTPGRSVEYKYVAKFLAGLFQSEDIRKIAFDRWNMRHFKPWLIEAGLSEAFIDDRFVDFGQGYISMSPALRTLEAVLLNGKMRHSDHPVMNMCAANAVVKSDEAGNRKLDKKRSSGRIDGMQSLAMSVAVAEEDGKAAPVFPVDPTRFVEDLSGQKTQKAASG